MFPSKKKMWQVSSPGGAELAWASNPCIQNIKNEGGERFGIQKLPPPLHSKEKECKQKHLIKKHEKQKENKT